MTTPESNQVGERSQTTVIDDGEFCHPVSTADLHTWEEKCGRLTAANYERFCDNVECSRPDLMVGSQEMIDVCKQAIEDGADCRHV